MNHQELENLVEKAKLATRKDDIDLALSLYDQVISQESAALGEDEMFQVLRARINRGVLYLNLEHHEQAENDWVHVAYKVKLPRSEWMDRIRIRALRNLATLEDLSPHRSPHIRQALKTFCDSDFFTVHRVLFDAALETTWIYDPDKALISFVRSLAGFPADRADLALIWTTLNWEERRLARAWWGGPKERGFLDRLQSIGPLFEDEDPEKPQAFHPPLCKINDNPYGRGGVKALFLGRNTLGWLTSNHQVEFLPDRRHSSQHVRLYAWCPKRETLAIVGDEKRHRIDLIKPTGVEKFQSRRAVTGIAWGSQVGWVDDGGFFNGTLRVDSVALDGVVFWKKAFWCWNRNGLWEIAEADHSITSKSPGGDLVLAGKHTMALVQGQTIRFWDDAQAEWTIQLPAPPEKGVLGPKRLSAWVVRDSLILYDRDRFVRCWDGLYPSALLWVSQNLIVGSQDWSFRILETSRSFSERQVRHHINWVTDLAFDESSGNLYVSSLDGQVSVWNFSNLELVDILAQKAALRLGWHTAWYRLGMSWVQEGQRTQILGLGDPWLAHREVAGHLHLLTLNGKLLSNEGRTSVPGTQGLSLIDHQVYLSKPGKLEGPSGTGWDLPDPEDWISTELRVDEDYVLGSAKGVLYRCSKNELVALPHQHQKAVLHLVELPRAIRYPGCDSPIFIASSGEDGRILVWDWYHLKPLEIVRNGGTPLKGLVCSGRVLVGWDGSSDILVWGIPGTSGHWSVKAHQGGVTACVLLPSGRFLLSSGRDGEVKAWRLPDVRLQSRLLKLDEPITDMAWGRKGILGVLGYSGEISEITLEHQFS